MLGQVWLINTFFSFTRGHARLVQVWLGYIRLGYLRLGKVRLGKVRLGKVRLGKVRLGQVTLINTFFSFSRGQPNDESRRTAPAGSHPPNRPKGGSGLGRNKVCLFEKGLKTGKQQWFCKVGAALCDHGKCYRYGEYSQ